MERIKWYSLWDRLHIWWIDASSDDEWVFLKDISKKSIRVETVGFYLDSTKDAIIIARSKSSHVGLEDKFMISWVMLEKMEVEGLTFISV